MLIPILGRAGSGKTTLMLQKTAEAAREGRVILIVPEQYSFEMEKQVYAMGPLAMQVEVYSFTRLCHRVFSECGGMAGEYVNDAARQILMNLALAQAKDQLDLYARPAKSPAFVGTMLRQVDEFKNAGVTPKQLSDFSRGAPTPQLMQKTHEMSLVYTYYQALLSQRFRDEKDSILRCCDLLEGRGYFEGCTILIDSFMTFMAGEKKLLRLMMQECKDLYLFLPCDGLSRTGDDPDGPIGDGTFDTARETLLQLIAQAHELSIPVKTPQVLTEQHRFQKEQLKHFERWLPSLRQQRCAQNDGAVTLCRAPNPYEEIRYVAAQIVQLVRAGKARYHEIAVIARDIDAYLTAVQDIFPKYDIPYFLDQREDVQSIPVFSLVFSALDALRTNFDTQHILALGKNPLLGLEETQVAQLENYCFLWEIDHGLWISPEGFRNHPRGLVEQFTDDDREQLAQIASTAQQICTPLLHLRDRLSHCSGQEFAAALYDFLIETGTKERLQQQAAVDVADPEQQRTQRLNAGAWEILCDLLDVFAHVLEDIELPLEQLRELFCSAATISDIGAIPGTLDQVALGSADRMRPNAPKVTFVIGANQGEFPPLLKENGLFSEAERDRLLESGIQLNPSVIKLANYEKYYLYAAMTSPSEQLFVTCHAAKLTGEATPDSPAITALERMFADFAPEQWTQSTAALSPLFYVANDQTAFETLCRILREDTPLTASLTAYVRTTPYAKRLQQVQQAMQSGSFRMQDRELSRLLFGNRMRLSPSRVERYFSCPFAYFCSGGLGLQPRRKVEISPMQSGTIIHFVLEKMVRTHGGKGLGELSFEQMLKEVQELLHTYLAERVSADEALSRRFRYLFERLSLTLSRLLCQLALEFAQSDFEPVRFELPIRQDGEVAPLQLRLDDGTEVLVEGVVDRVDLMEKEGRRYVRVVDYKSGSKNFKLDDVYYGLN